MNAWRLRLSAKSARQKNTTQHSTINKGQKKALWLSGDRRGGTLAHIRLIRGPQSPLTFASQSQVVRRLCYRLEDVSPVGTVLCKSFWKQWERVKHVRACSSVQISAPRTAFKGEIHLHNNCVLRFILDLGNSRLEFVMTLDYPYVYIYF